MAIQGQIQPRKTSSRRGSNRLRLRLQALGSTSSADASPVLIHNLSATGLLLEMAAPPAAGSEMVIDLPEAGDVAATVVWTSDDFVGCRFARPLSPAALSAALLRNPIKGGLADDGGVQRVPRETFAERLTRLRQLRGFSRAELAARAGISKPSLWAWETGRTPPRQNNIRSLARALDLSEEVLLGTADPAGDHAAPPGGRTTTFASVIAESKARIAEVAGSEPEDVRIILEF